MPTRLVDVGISDLSTVRLIKTKGETGGGYTTLSHCWGTSINLLPRTTRRNIDAHMGGIYLRHSQKH